MDGGSKRSERPSSVGNTLQSENGKVKRSRWFLLCELRDGEKKEEMVVSFVLSDNAFIYMVSFRENTDID
jgi:hypothetical protein